MSAAVAALLSNDTANALKVNTVAGAFQTRLLCIEKKPCLSRKEALFGEQRSLVCNPPETSLCAEVLG